MDCLWLAAVRTPKALYMEELGKKFAAVFGFRTMFLGWRWCLGRCEEEFCPPAEDARRHLQQKKKRRRFEWPRSCVGSGRARVAVPRDGVAVFLSWCLLARDFVGDELRTRGVVCRRREGETKWTATGTQLVNDGVRGPRRRE